MSIISIVVLIVVGSAIYNEIYKKKISSSRIPCHNDATVFEKRINNKYLDALKEDIYDKNVSIVISKKESIYTKTTLFKYIRLEDIKNILKRLLHVNNADNHSKNTLLSVYVYENDPEDPNKKVILVNFIEDI